MCASEAYLEITLQTQELRELELGPRERKKVLEEESQPTAAGGVPGAKADATDEVGAGVALAWALTGFMVTIAE